MDKEQGKWTKGQNGEWIMPEIPRQYLDWLLSYPREPATHNEWGRENNVHPTTLLRWRKEDARFIAEWDRRASRKWNSPEKTDRIMEELWRKATETNSIEAIKLYVQITDRWNPKSDRSDQDISDAELGSMTEAELDALLGLETDDDTDWEVESGEDLEDVPQEPPEVRGELLDDPPSLSGQDPLHVTRRPARSAN